MRRFIPAIALVIVLLGAITGESARAEDGVSPKSPECRAVRWPYARKQPRKDLLALFARARTGALTRYFIYEVTTPAPDSELAYLLYQYLKDKSPSGSIKGFFDFIAKGALLHDENSVLRKIELDDVCYAYTRSLEFAAQEAAQREPQSIKPKRKTTAK
jgi:hypothetical protein